MKFQTQNAADHSDVLALQMKLTQAADKLSHMAPQVAVAKQVKEFSNDRTKRALAIAALPFIKAGESSAAADTCARSSDGYKLEMQKLATEFQQAEKALLEWEAQKIQWESARSLLAMQRDLSRNL
jgi:hypothetical protein